jgi:hypothetical protein
MFVDREPEDQLCLMLAWGDLFGKLRERALQLLLLSVALASVSRTR